MRGLGGLGGVARLQPREDLHPARPPVGHLEPGHRRHQRRLHQDRHADVRRGRRIEAGEARRRDADDRHRVVVDRDLPADDLRVALEAVHPVVVAEDDDRVAVVDAVVLLRGEDAPDRRLHAQHREEVAGHQLRVDPLGLVVDRQRRGHVAPRDDLGERGALLLEVHVHGVGVHPAPHVAAVVRPLLVDLHQRAGVGDRQAPQHHLVDQREDRGRRPDAEGEREDGDDGEQGAATEPADGIAEIA